MPKVLIDTSAWVEFFRADGDPRYQQVIGRLLDEDDAAVCGATLAEVLRGARTDAEYRELTDRFSSLIYFPMPETLWATMGRHGSHLLRRGVTVPTMDLLIATVAMENHAAVLHKDRHFPLIARHTALRLFVS
ncbi:MAG: PIN domain-containing protein [Deltaproteobacteria bacterium]|nr:PIN domain-containing protein [Deltaproteobacteria bacterium]